MKFTLPQIRKFTIFFALGTAFFIAGAVANEKGIIRGTAENGIKISTTPSAREDMTVFWQVWDIVHADYFNKAEIDNKKLLYGAIKGMVSAIGDPYTAFFPPEEQKRTQEDLGGEFEGVGIQIGFKGSRLAVIAPLEGTPAQVAGVRSGDFIIGIKDEQKDLETSTIGMTLIDAVEAIRGPAGSQVTLILTRESQDEPLEITVTRARIEVPSVELSFQENIAHLKLIRFGDNTDQEWNQAIITIAQTNPTGIVLDLRNNPGGYLNGSVSIVSEFVREGTAVIQEDSRGAQKKLTVSGNPRLPNIPMVVLVNAGSASASEIVAGALHDHSRATLLGETTFGKGTIQEAKTLNASGLHITTARWLTPNGNWINETGITPSVEIEDDPETEVDEQLQSALERLR